MVNLCNATYLFKVRDREDNVSEVSWALGDFSDVHDLTTGKTKYIGCKYLEYIQRRPAFKMRKFQTDSCYFNNLFRRNLIHILETIFLSLDYESLKRCYEVCGTWNEFLSSQSLTSRAFRREMREMERREQYRQRQIRLLKIEENSAEFISRERIPMHLFSRPEKEFIPHPDSKGSLLSRVLGDFRKAQEIITGKTSCIGIEYVHLPNT